MPTSFKILVTTLLFVQIGCQQAEPPKFNLPDFSVVEATNLSQLAFHCIDQPYPYKPGITLGDSTYLRQPQDYHPAFYGCFDWHSAVHGHWSLIRLLKLFPDLPNQDAIRRKLGRNLTPENLLMEVRYFQDEHNKNFERTYGWAWLLKLAAELADWDDTEGRQWATALKPLEELMVQKLLQFLPKLSYPIRTGEHTNTAFALALAYDYANSANHDVLRRAIADKAQTFYLGDANCPAGWEPSGFDFLSPCLEEAEVMARVLPQAEFRKWFNHFLKDPEHFQPAVVTDRTDGKIVHLDGLNFSRAWCLYRIADALGDRPDLLALGDQHVLASLPNVKSGDYAGEHWLASFALLALSSRSGDL